MQLIQAYLLVGYLHSIPTSTEGWVRHQEFGKLLIVNHLYLFQVIFCTLISLIYIADRYVISLNFLGGLKPLTDPKGNIKFQNVVFNYPNRPDAPILNGLELEIPSGMIYALVGHSGSGKSTLGHLLLRLYDPQNGQVCLDGTDIKMYDPVWLHSHIGVVSQVSHSSLSKSINLSLVKFD